MTDHTPLRADTVGAIVSSGPSRSASLDVATSTWDRPVVEDAPSLSLWQVLRRRAPFIALCGALAAVAGLFATSRLPRLYEASVSIRVDPKGARLSAIGVPNALNENALATELEMLRSRALIGQVVDSTAFRLQLTKAKASTRERPRSSVMTEVRVAADAPAGAYRLTPVEGGGGQIELWRLGDDELIATVDAAAPIRFRGISLRLTPEGESSGPIEFDVLPIDDAVDSLNARTTVSRRGRDADLIDVRVRGGDPELVRDVANATGRLYIANHEDARQLEARRSVAFLRDQLTRASRQLSSAEHALRDYRTRAGVVSLRDEASTGVSHRAELFAQRNATNAEREALQRLLESTAAPANRRAGGSYRELLAFPTLLRSDAAVGLQTALTSAEQRRSELVIHRTERDAEVKALDARIDELHGQLRGFVTTYLQGLTNQVQALDATLSRSDNALATLPEKELRQAELERNAKTTESLYGMLQERFKEAEIAAAATDESIRLVDAAVLPRRPVSPKPGLTMMLAVGVGVLIGAAGAFAREAGDHSLRTRSQLVALTGSPVLSLVPRLQGVHGLASLLPRFGGRRATLLNTDTHESGSRALVGRGRHGSAAPYTMNDLFGFAESYARLVTNLGISDQSRGLKVLLVTSALPGDGKTTVATNLAFTLAREGKRVLLIDADLRGGRVASMLGLSSASGLAEALARAGDLKAVVSRVPAGGGRELHVLPRGKATGDPASLLGSDAPGELLAQARALYDTVVIDSPPVNAVADAALLTRYSDGVLVVARARATGRDALVFAMEQLRMVRAPIIGAVLNDVDLRRDAGVDGAYQYYGQYPTGSTA